MDDLNLLWMDLRDEFEEIPEECFELRHLWLRVMLDVELALQDSADHARVTNFVRWPH